jgi:nucleotide-binding universal stress UspA family protein
MTYRMLVPLSGGDSDAEILPYVRRLSPREDTRITLLHVLPDLCAYEQSYINGQCDQASRKLERFRARLDHTHATVQGEVRMGEPVTEIVRLAALLPADLILMPTHARKGIERLVSGSVAEHVMRQAHAPLLLLPRTGGQSRERDIQHLFDRILVPIDGKPGGYSIIPLVAEFARCFGSEVILFHDYRGLADSGEVIDNRKIDERIEDYRALLGYAGIPVSLQSASNGRPAAKILAAVSASNADIIAMATHGRAGLGRLANGSVAEYVLRNAACPLLVCRSVAGVTPPAGANPSG